MDSYVIRIYRRDVKDLGRAAGQVEFIEKGRVRSFANVDELVKLLGLKERRTKKAASKKKSAKQSSEQGRKS